MGMKEDLQELMDVRKATRADFTMIAVYQAKRAADYIETIAKAFLLLADKAQETKRTPNELRITIKPEEAGEAYTLWQNIILTEKCMLTTRDPSERKIYKSDLLGLQGQFHTLIERLARTYGPDDLDEVIDPKILPVVSYITNQLIIFLRPEAKPDKREIKDGHYK